MLKHILLLAATFGAPSLLHGQACFSNPVSARGAAIEVKRDAAADLTGYGSDLRVNFAGPLSAELGYRLMTSDTLHSHGNSFLTGIAGELSHEGLSFCAGAAPKYASYREPEVFLDSLGVVLDVQEQTHRMVTIPIELSVGKSVKYGAVALLPSVGAAYVSQRFEVSSSRPLESSASFVQTRVALAIALQSLFGRLQLTTSSLDAAVPTISAGLGVLLR